MYRFRDDCIAERKESYKSKPFGADEFYAIVEKLTGRDICPGRPGCLMQ